MGEKWFLALLGFVLIAATWLIDIDNHFTERLIVAHMAITCFIGALILNVLNELNRKK